MDNVAAHPQKRRTAVPWVRRISALAPSANTSDTMAKRKANDRIKIGRSPAGEH